MAEGVSDGESVLVALSVGLGVSVGVRVFVLVGDGVSVAVSLAVEVLVWLGVREGVNVGEKMGLGVAVWKGVTVGCSVGRSKGIIKVGTGVVGERKVAHAKLLNNSQINTKCFLVNNCFIICLSRLGSGQTAYFQYTFQRLYLGQKAA